MVDENVKSGDQLTLTQEVEAVNPKSLITAEAPLMTENGDIAFSLKNRALEFFGKAGSQLSARRQLPNNTNLKATFEQISVKDPITATRLLMWLGSPRRPGAGNRYFSRLLLKWASKDPKMAPWVEANLEAFPTLQRWDVLGTFVNTPLHNLAMKIWAEAILKKHKLACKWVPRRNKKAKTAGVRTALRKALGMENGVMRRHISANTNVIETALCNGGLEDWPIANTPGVALSKNTNTLMAKVPEKYIEALVAGDLNTDVLYPHEIWRMANSGSKLDLSIAVDALFNALPDYAKTGENIMCMADVSGSMECPAGSETSSISCKDVALAMSMYLTDRIEGPLHRKMIAFSGQPAMMDWDKLGSVNACMTGRLYEEIRNNGDAMNTDLCKAIKTTVDFAKVMNIPKDRMPTCLVIFSDMQFDQMKHFYGFTDSGSYYGSQHGDDKTLSSIVASIQYWEDNGFNRPAVVFWNLSPHKGNPAPELWGEIAYVSGFNPAIMKEVLESFEVVIKADGTKTVKLDPVAAMERTLMQYPVKTPKVIV